MNRPFRWWNRQPLYLRILIGLVLGIVTGLILGSGAKSFDQPARLVLRILGALAPPLILVAVIHAIITAEIRGRVALRMAGLLLANTFVAIVVGLVVANVIKPGRHANLPRPTAPTGPMGNVMNQILDNIPSSLLGPFVDNKVIGVVLIAVAFGAAARTLPTVQKKAATDLAALAFSLILVVLSWVIALVPFAVFGKVASIVGTSGFAPFAALG
ncbi:MAG: dicarboxylate/amino acid:cation symporter, partial [Deltaproteobacteria bacterium]|nr:dicarboxylate/amino acid:cation symporter [Deltaproteobacteria bacterium]